MGTKLLKRSQGQEESLLQTADVSLGAAAWPLCQSSCRGLGLFSCYTL